MPDEPKRCRECRFYSDGYCLHDEAKSYTAIGDTKWERAEHMRRPTSYGNGVGACGEKAALWEPRPPIPATSMVLRLSPVIALVGFIIWRSYF